LFNLLISLAAITAHIPRGGDSTDAAKKKERDGEANPLLSYGVAIT
jgi:hypothetical protein